MSAEDSTDSREEVNGQKINDGEFRSPRPGRENDKSKEKDKEKDKEGFGGLFGPEGVSGWFKSKSAEEVNRKTQEDMNTHRGVYEDMDATVKRKIEEMEEEMRKQEEKESVPELPNIDEVRRILGQMSKFSVKELRELLAVHSKINKTVCGDYLEKDEMRKSLKDMLMSSLTPAEVILINSEIHGKEE